MSEKPRPSELRFSKESRCLDIAFDDGARFEIPFELLRVESPSAEVQGHGGDQKQIVPGKRSVGVAGAESMGNYAVRIAFDDGHDTGIFSWDYLYELGVRKDALLLSYFGALKAAGLSRDG